MENMQNKTRSGHIDALPLLCPICGRELEDSKKTEKGWDCKCGEFIPHGLVIDPFEGCTHGKSCNCGRARPSGRA